MKFNLEMKIQINTASKGYTLSKRKKLKRIRELSEIQQGNSEKLGGTISDQAGRRRRKKTEACNVIHGGTPKYNNSNS